MSHRSTRKGGVVKDSDDMDVLSALQDILDEVVNGREDGHKCPFCKDGVLEATVEPDVKVKLECGSCKRIFEGRLS